MSSNFSSPFLAKSPFNNDERKQAEQDPDSSNAVAAWQQFKQDYMVRKFKGNDERLGPITPEQNKDEYDREKLEFYFNTDENKMKLIPTDDAEIRDENFVNNLKRFQIAPEDKNQQ